MGNPFEEPDANYRVLSNAEEQHSLWPASTPVPEGWTVAHGPGPRDQCLAYIRDNWQDLRPRSVSTFIAEHAGG